MFISPNRTIFSDAIFITIWYITNISYNLNATELVRS